MAADRCPSRADVYLRLSLSSRYSAVSDREQPGLPREVSRLLDARTPTGVDAAWSDFVAVYSRLLLHVARAVTSDRDAAMDAYAHVLERLHEHDFRRLRTYVADGRSKFTTWLVAVVRRLCYDWHRQRFGRDRAESTDSAKVALERRRRLTTLMSEAGLDTAADLVDASTEENAGPEGSLRALELSGALEEVLATLPPADQVLLRLRFDDDFSAQQIARMLHFPTPFHVYRRINAVLATLREALRARGIESSVP